MSCSSCKYLNEKKKKAGKSSGAIYYCEKQKSFVYGSDNACKDYKMNSNRSDTICEEIYKNGKLFSDDTIPVSVYLLVLIILIILAIIFNLFS